MRGFSIQLDSSKEAYKSKTDSIYLEKLGSNTPPCQKLDVTDGNYVQQIVVAIGQSHVAGISVSSSDGQVI